MFVIGGFESHCAVRRLSVLGLLAGVGALLSLAGGPVAANAAGAKRHKLNVTAVFRALTTHSATFTATGTISGRPFGSGAVIRQVTGSGSVISVKFTWFTTRGSVSGQANETRTLHPDGSFTFAVTKGRILRGTGSYRGATGTFAGTGTLANLNSATTERLHGSVKF